MSQEEAKDQPPPLRGVTRVWLQEPWPAFWPHQVKRASAALSRQMRVAWVMPRLVTFCSHRPGVRAGIATAAADGAGAWTPEVGGAPGTAGGCGAWAGFRLQAERAARLMAVSTRALRILGRPPI